MPAPRGPWSSEIDENGGGGSSYNFADEEVPTGVVDGVNVTFTLAHAPNPPSSLKLYGNLLRLRSGTHYTISGSTITYTNAPQSGDSHIADYRY